MFIVKEGEKKHKNTLMHITYGHISIGRDKHSPMNHTHTHTHEKPRTSCPPSTPLLF